jgi:hypothetical protein
MGRIILDSTTRQFDLASALHTDFFCTRFIVTWLDVSDVLCRYSLGTNPRGVKDILIYLSLYFSYYT